MDNVIEAMRWFYFLCLLLASTVLVTVDIGSDTSVTRFDTQVTLNDGDRIAGFAGLNAGFRLFDSTVTGLYDNFFPVSGDILLNGGVLNLNQDLIFFAVSNLVSMGTINANKHAIHLAPTMTTVPSGDLVDCNLTFVTDATFGTQNVIVNDWSFNDLYIALGLTSGTNDELQVYGFDGSNLTPLDSVDFPSARVATLSWHPSQLLLAVGSQPVAAAPELRMYSFDGSSLTLEDSIEFGTEIAGVKFHKSGDYLAVTKGTVSEINIYPVSSAGIFGTPATATIAPDNPDIDSLDWDLTGSFLAVGTASAGASTPTTYVFDFQTAPSLSITQNASIVMPGGGSRVRDVAWNPQIANYVAVATHATPEVVMYEHDADAGTLTSIATISAGGPNGLGLGWNRNGECLALSTANNGAAGEFQTYFLDTTAISFSLIDDFEIGVNAREPTWSRNGKFVSHGQNNPGALSVYKVDAANRCFIISNGRLFLNSNVEFRDLCLTFTGNNIVNGAGNTLTLDLTSTLQIDEEASVLFQDIRILGMREAKLQMIDSTSTASFKDVVMHLDTDYTFTQGRFDVIRGFRLEGKGKTFTYTSDQVSTVILTGVFEMGPETTFRYAPSIASKTLLKLGASSSIFMLDSATLSMTSTGLQLDTGQFIVDGKSLIISEGSNSAEGMVWGDGINNLCVEWDPAAQLQIDGFLRNANIN